MSGFGCVCGYHFDMNSQEDEYFLAKAEDLDQIGELLKKPGGLSEDYYFDILDRKGNVVYVCPDCGRLHLSEGKSDSYIPYAKEQP